jgi:glucose-6-phosphate 1-dehydrogenase
MLLGRLVYLRTNFSGAPKVLTIFEKIFTPILHWIDGVNGPRPRPVPYPYGSRGPKELDAFIQKYGYKRNTEA